VSIEAIDINHNPVTAWERFHLSLYPGAVGRSADFFDFERERSAEGCFGKCSFKMRGTRENLEPFFEYGLGRDVRVRNSHGLIDYEGFIFSMKLNTGINHLKKSMRAIFNKGKARYDASGGVDPTQRSNEWDDLYSQARFGVIERIIGGGQQSGLSAIDQAVQNKLKWYSWPMIDPDFGVGRGDPWLEIVCMPYMHTLKWRVYNQTTNTGNADLSTVATDIVSDCGDFIASYTVHTNVLQVPQEYDMDRVAYDAIHGLAEMGDSAGNRWLARVVENRHFILGPAARII
jgi:hypothetical protein